MSKNLDRRLEKVASFVKADSRVCDVGCDHAYLSAFLYLRGDIKSVCATEVNIKPLENAKRTLKKEGITDIKLIHCDGLSGVTDTDVDTVIIAGMGGDVISGIIDRAPHLHRKKVTYILQPMTAAVSLRRYLCENGFYLKEESAVTDGGRVYSVMCAKFDGRKRTPSPLFERIGKITGDTGDNLVYIKRQISLLNEYLQNIKGLETHKAETEKTEKLIKQLKRKAGI